MADYIGPAPLNQYFNDNGAPLAGGKLYSYAAGTSTPQATYASSSGTPNTNPLILDASGRGLFYIPAGVGYKFNLTDSAGVQISGYPVDNYITPSPAIPPAPAAVPTGTILPYGGAAAPTSYLLCDHSAVDRATYSALFSVIGATYGVGDGITTFNLPDMRGMFPLGKATAGTGSTLGATGGAINHTHTYTQVVNHTHAVSITDAGHNHLQNAHNHTITDPGHTHSTGNFSAANAAAGGAQNALNGGGNTSSSTTGITVDNTTATNIAATTGITASTANPAGGVASGTTATQNPPFLTFNFIIKI